MIPAVGTTELQLRFAQIVTAMHEDKLPRRWLDLRSPKLRHRGWISLEKPEGREVRTVTVGWFTAHIGQVAYDLRGGVTFEVTDRHGVRCYADWTGLDDVAQIGGALQRMVRRREGTQVRTRLAEIWPLETEART